MRPCTLPWSSETGREGGAPASPNATPPAVRAPAEAPRRGAAVEEKTARAAATAPPPTRSSCVWPTAASAAGGSCCVSLLRHPHRLLSAELGSYPVPPFVCCPVRCGPGVGLVCGNFLLPYGPLPHAQPLPASRCSQDPD